MSDERDIVERLRSIDHMSVEDCFLQSPMFSKAADEIERLRAELAQWQALDANAVHINMLRGTMPKLTPKQIGHLYRGDEAGEVLNEVITQNGMIY